jgi:hypothetical protein
MSYSAITLYRTWPSSGPLQAPDSDLDYSYDATIETQDGADPIVEASIAVQPSGAGDVSAHDFSVAGSVLTVWMRGGVAGRRYRVRLEFATASGRAFERIIMLPIDPILATFPVPTVPSTAFSDPLTWTPLGQARDSDGNLVVDSDGNPLFTSDVSGSSGGSTAQQATDSAGNLLFDSDGNPVFTSEAPGSTSGDITILVGADGAVLTPGG